MTEYLNQKLPPMRAAVKAKILFFLSFLIIGFPLLGFEETLVLGEEDRWARLSLMDNLQFIPGLRGYPDLTLRDGEYRPDSATDLLLHFNQEPILPPSPTYRILRGGGG